MGSYHSVNVVFFQIWHLEQYIRACALPDDRLIDGSTVCRPSPLPPLLGDGKFCILPLAPDHSLYHGSHGPDLVAGRVVSAAVLKNERDVLGNLQRRLVRSLLQVVLDRGKVHGSLDHLRVPRRRALVNGRRKGVREGMCDHAIDTSQRARDPLGLEKGFVQGIVRWRGHIQVFPVLFEGCEDLAGTLCHLVIRSIESLRVPHDLLDIGP
mmetsp:Transcript_3441/g.10033  ORF Transcript_3441/g.10033 Transcript_3441/m.10033 type:complete len:210 (+) Transcript_3441:914-1543(+)